MFDQDLLTAFCEQFYGYGDLSAPVWFIGMEEGGGATHQEVIHRLSAWHELGRPPTAEVHDFHARIDLGNHFDLNGPVESQSTWRQLIRTMLVGTGTRRRCCR